MAYRRLTLIVAVTLATTGCSLSGNPEVDDTVPVDVTTTVTSSIPTTVTSSIPTTDEPPAASPVARVVHQCSPPAADVGEGSAEIHQAISVVVERTNALGAALLEIDEFSSGWEEDEPVASIVESLLIKLAEVERITTDVLTTKYGATYDAEGVAWVFPESMWPLSPEYGSLEELAMAPELYRDDILPLMFSMTTLDEAVDHWNYGSSPCGHANGMVERLEAAKTLFSS
jgi:hypothetical protein